MLPANGGYRQGLEVPLQQSAEAMHRSAGSGFVMTLRLMLLYMNCILDILSLMYQFRPKVCCPIWSLLTPLSFRSTKE